MKNKICLILLTFFFLCSLNASATEYLATNLQGKYLPNADFTWTNYIKSINHRLKSNWFPSKRPYSVEVSFQVTSEGNYKNIKILTPSKNKKDNQAALDAVMYSFPCKPLPGKAGSIDVRYKFPSGLRSVTLN